MDPPHCPWERFAPAVIDHCEDRPCAWIREPANAWSCLVYVALGVWLVARARREGARALVPIGASAILVGALSFGLHASMTLAWEFLDFFSMYTFSTYALVVTWYRFRGGSARAMVALYAGILGASLVCLAAFKQTGALLFGGQVAGILALELHLRTRRGGALIRYRDLGLLLAFFGASLAVWLLEFTRVWCDPANHWLQGHGVWHVLNSTCFYWYYRYCQQFDLGRPGASSP